MSKSLCARATGAGTIVSLDGADIHDVLNYKVIADSDKTVLTLEVLITDAVEVLQQLPGSARKGNSHYDKQ